MHLIVTSKRDLTSDFVVRELQRRRLPYLRLNTEDMPSAAFQCRPTADCSWTFTWADTSFELSHVTAAYFRRPGVPEPVVPMHEADRAYCTQEWNAALQSMYWALGDRWLNSPHAIALAENKIYQLALAASLGFKVPETLVGNDPIATTYFVTSGPTIGKPLRNALVKGAPRDRVIFTTRIAPNDKLDVDAIKASPIVLQREISKQFDVRVTVVGDSVFAATIDSQCDPDTEVDWRRTSNADLAHAAYDLPENVANQCISLTRKLGLRFGAIDLILDRNDELWFLEINPNGQWAWIETRTGHPISAAIVSEMERIAHA